MTFSKFFCFLACFFIPFAIGAIEVEEMTLEEKVGQLFMAYFDGEEVNDHAERLIKETKIGGIIYYKWANGLTDPYMIRNMSSQLQALANEHISIPLLISIDQEGGTHVRLVNGFTQFPGNGALGRTGQPDLSYKAAKAMGMEMNAVGINMNLAPVVDVNSNPKNPIIGVRSFGDDPDLVAKLGGASVKGFLDAGIIPCLKHFPGHGDVTVDSHHGLPIVSKDYLSIEKVELYPFKKLSLLAPAIMTSHICFTSLDSRNCVTLSSKVLKGVLREELKYDGVLISDSLMMKGVLEGQESVDEVVVKAFEAGNDILLIGGRGNIIPTEANINEIVRLYHGLLAAVRAGRISEERVNESVQRILNLKVKMGLFDRAVSDSRENLDILANGNHKKLAKEIAYRSVIVKEGCLPTDISQKKVVIIAPKVIADNIEGTDLMKLGDSTVLYSFEELNPSEKEQQEVIDLAGKTDYIVFCSYNAWKCPKQLELINNAAKLRPSACVAVADPYDLDVCGRQEVLIATYSPVPCSLQVAAEWILGKMNSPNIFSEND